MNIFYNNFYFLTKEGRQISFCLANEKWKFISRMIIKFEMNNHENVTVIFCFQLFGNRWLAFCHFNIQMIFTKNVIYGKFLHQLFIKNSSEAKLFRCFSDTTQPTYVAMTIVYFWRWNLMWFTWKKKWGNWNCQRLLWKNGF